MNRRDVVRYGSEELPGIMNKVTVSWEENTLNGAYVVNYCSNGVSITIPPFLNRAEMPGEQATVKVLMPIGQMWFAGKCVYVKTGPDGSVCMGIHFSDPKEQTYLKDLLFNTLNVPVTSDSFVSYEWEELVEKLCDSEDPKLQKIGFHHMAIIKAKQYGLQMSQLMAQ